MVGPHAVDESRKTQPRLLNDSESAERRGWMDGWMDGRGVVRVEASCVPIEGSRESFTFLAVEAIFESNAVAKLLNRLAFGLQHEDFRPLTSRAAHH